jgi:N-acylglucosamine-6-phosphate 2-epimerase
LTPGSLDEIPDAPGSGRSLLDSLRGELIVSCQADPGEPLRQPEIIAALAQTTVLAGAACVRVNGPKDVAAVRGTVSVPIVGLWKDGRDGVYITPTAEHARAVIRAGADIVAVDGTSRPRPDGKPLAVTIEAIHAAGCLALADVSVPDEGKEAEAAGADVIATTLSGYTLGTQPGDQPDLDVIEALTAKVAVPVIAEGRIHTPAQAREALERGAWAVVVGTAISSPGWITQQFVKAVKSGPVPG